MAVTGLFLFSFVVIHMIGNLQIFLGREALNGYAEHLREWPLLLWPARAFLFLALLLHIFTSFSLAIENRKARPVRYRYEATVQASYASRTMVASGVIIFLFVVYHLLHFTWGVVHPEFFHLTDGKGRHDVYSMVILGFRDRWVTGSYVAAMAVLCMHLSHGVQSLFQSLGLNNEKTTPFFIGLSIVIAVVIFVGNTSISLASMLGFLKLPSGVM